MADHQFKALPSDVVEDSDVDIGSRVPTFGLHPHLGGGKDHPKSWERHDSSSRCDSGICDSFNSGTSSLRNSLIGAGEVTDSMQSMSLRESEHTTLQRLPSVDEGFHSESLKESDIVDLPKNIVFPPEIEPEPQQSSGSSWAEDIFLQDEDGDT